MPYGIIKKSTGSWYEIWTENHKTVLGRIKGKFRLEDKKFTNPIAVGDRVEYKEEDNPGNVTIDKLLPRNNYIIRKASNLSRQYHVVAANIDQLLILATVAWPRTSQGFIDRLLVTAEAYHIPAVIVFNKSDIYTPGIMQMQEELASMYSHIGYKVFTVSALKGDLAEIKEQIHNKTTLISGHSGTGKTTLLNALDPDLQLKTANISEFSLKGKHTTTFAEMHILDDKTYVIDTPGIKEFGLSDMKKEEISHLFPEMRSLLGQCKFNNCLHVNEPGCVVIEAVEKGEIYPQRYQSYLSILSEEETHR